MTSTKPTIICIVGESGTGKSYIADMLDSYYDIPMIESRTTRPRRKPDEGGHLYVTDEEYNTYNPEEMIAYTTFGTERYCCLIQDIKPGMNTYVIDEDGLTYLRYHFSDRFNIFAVRVITPMHIREQKVDKERLARDEGRFLMGPEEFDYHICNSHDKSTSHKVTKLYLRIESKFNSN